MNYFDFPNNDEIIASIQEMLHCPFCGSNYSRPDIKIMSKIDSNNVVSLFCRDCKNSIMASLSFNKEVGSAIRKKTRLDMSFKDMIHFIKRGPIDDNSVMDFFKTLKKFDGDFKKIFPVDNINKQRRKRL